MSMTFEEYFEKGRYFCFAANYTEAYDCFKNALTINFDVNLFWNKIESSPSMKGYYKIFFSKCMDTILTDLELELSKYDEIIVDDITSKLNNYMLILSKCLILSSKTKEWAKVYKLLGKIYCIIGNFKDAYECFKSALYFNKSIGVKSNFNKLVKKYGENDRVDDEEFEYALINNIFFKNIYKGPCTPLRIVKRLDGIEDFVEERSGKIKFYSKGSIVGVEKIAIDYYNKLGYKAYHCEGGIINSLSVILFKDLYDEYSRLIDGDYSYYIDLMENRLSKLNKNNYRSLLLEYYKYNKKHEEGYYSFDYIEYLGYDEWINIIELIGIEKCFNYVRNDIYKDDWYNWPNAGMPDLLVHNDNEVLLVEVKSTRDKLSNKQIWQHRWLSKQLDIPIIIFMVNKNQKQIHNIKKQYLI